MFQNLLNKIIRFPYLLISLIVSIANWQLLTGLKSLQWDMINFWLPWRYYIAECYTNGIIPLWNPYSQAGYPLHGDLQGPAYAWETMLSSFLFPINSLFLNYLYVAYLIFGAIGLFKLYKFFVTKFESAIPPESSTDLLNIAGVIAAVSYVLCGYVSWHGHYFYMIISVCLIPWIYYYAFRIFSGGTWLDSIKLAFFVWWQLTAGNPSYLIVTFYFLVFVFIICFVNNIRKKIVGLNKKIIFQFSLAGLVSVVLCAPIFLNAYKVFPLTSRAGGIGLEWAGEESLRFNDVFSIFNSFMAYERDFKAGAEQPIYNLYIAIFIVFFAIIAFWKIRNFWTKILLFLSVLSLLLSIGLATPVYGLFHRFLPMFNVFRMPNLIIIYCYLFGAIMGGIGFLFVYKEKKYAKHFLYFSASVLLVSVIAIVYFKVFYTESRNDFKVDNETFKTFLWSQPQLVKSILALVTTSLVLIIGSFLIWKNKFKILLIFIVFDVFVNYQIGAIARVFGDVSATYASSYSKGLNKGFAPPDLIADKDIPCFNARMEAFWMNAATFIQQPIHLNDNNFELTNYMKLLNEHGNELNSFIKQPYVYFVDTLVAHEGVNDSIQLNIAAVDKSIADKYASVKLSNSYNRQLTVKQFEPHDFKFVTKSSSPSAICLQQNLCPLWTIKVNGKEVKPDTAFYSFPLLMLPSGNNEISFEYRLEHYSTLFLISILLAVLIVLIVVLKSGLRSKIKIGLMSLFLLLVIFCFYSFKAGQSKLKNSSIEKSYSIYKSEIANYKDIKLILNSRDELIKDFNCDAAKYNFFFNEDLAAFVQEIKKSKTEFLALLDYKALHTVEMERLIKIYYGEIVQRVGTDYGQITIYKKNSLTEKPIYEQYIDFESEQSNWYIEDSITNNTSLKLMKGNEFGGGMDFTMEQIGAKAGDLVYVSCDLTTNATNFPGMCLSVDREGVNKKFLTYTKFRKTNEKIRLAIYWRIPDYVRKNDLIKVFMWNNSEIPAYIDNMNVQVISN